VLPVESAKIGVLVCAVLLTIETPADAFYEIIREYDVNWQVIISCLAVAQPHGPYALVARNKPILASFSDNLTVFGIGTVVRCERNRTDIGLRQTR
jgi:hypothetical protein